MSGCQYNLIEINDSGQLILLNKPAGLVQQKDNKILFCKVGLDFWGEGRDDSNKTGGYSFINLNNPKGYLTTNKTIPNLLPAYDYKDTIGAVKQYVHPGAFNCVTLMGSPVNGSGEAGASVGNDAASIRYVLNQQNGMVIIYGKDPESTNDNKALTAIKNELPQHEMYSFKNIPSNNEIYILQKDKKTIFLKDDYSSINIDSVIVIFYPIAQIHKNQIIVENEQISYRYTDNNYTFSTSPMIPGEIQSPPG